MARIAPGGVHVQGTQIVQQPGSGQGCELLRLQTAAHPQIQSHQHHLQAVQEKVGHLLAQHRQLESDGRCQRQRSQRLQQWLRVTQGLAQQQWQGFGLQHLPDGLLQRFHIHGVGDRQVRIQWLAQLVLHQAVVQAAVNAGALFHQLDAAFAVNRVLCDHRTALGHVRHTAQVMGPVLHTVAGLEQWVCHEKLRGCLRAL